MSMPYPTRPDDIQLFGSDDFLANRWDILDGEHVTILGSSGAGKTVLARRLMLPTLNTERLSLTLGFKPEDEELTRTAKILGHPIVPSFPPSSVRRFLSSRQPTGYVIWPQPPMAEDPDEYEHQLATVFNRTIAHAYALKRRKKSVHFNIFADEAVELAELTEEREDARGKRKALPVERWMNAVWSRGRSLGVGMWAATQRPAGLPLKAYQAHHLFLAYEPDARNRQRFAEIGGVDPKLVSATVQRLPDFYWLYLRRRGRKICIVGP